VSERARVRLDDVSMVYPGGVEACRKASLDIRDGEFVSILGPSGCGKSTLLLLIAGLRRATGGQIYNGGTLVDGPQTDIGIVFQTPVLLDWLRVIDNVMLQVRARGLPEKEYRARAMSLLARVGLTGFEHVLPHQLSGGMSQRASVCRALIHDPDLLLMDEPFGALDALTREQMMLDLQMLMSGTNKTVVFVTHSIPEAVFLSDRVVVMTPRPGEMAHVIEVALPKPRQLSAQTSPQFIEHTANIVRIFQSYGLLTEEGSGRIE
jgi:NitT/TauT family transport system ATP-binding protein